MFLNLSTFRRRKIVMISQMNSKVIEAIGQNFNRYAARTQSFISMSLEGAFSIQLISTFISRSNFTMRKKYK